MVVLSVNNYEGLRSHVGHDFECVVYSGGENISLECVTCNVVIMDFDRE